MTYINIEVRVPQKVADVIREGKISVKDLSNLVANYYSQLFSQTGVIDTQPADDGATRTQERWIPHFNQQGQIMIPAPIVYRIGQNGTPELVESVRGDFRHSRLVTSTREKYHPDTLGAEITQNYGSTIIQPTERRVFIPIYQGTPLNVVLKAEEGVAYLRTKFDTNDTANKIGETLAALSGESIDDIYVWTPDFAGRENYRERAAGFSLPVEGFRVNGNLKIGDDYGRSRGVSVKSAKPTRKNRN